MLSNASADFSRVRVRSFFLFCIVWVVISGLALLLAKSLQWGDEWFVLFLWAGFFLGMLAWAAWQCTRAGTSLRQLLDAWPTPADWSAGLVLFPTYVFLFGLYTVQHALFPHVWRGINLPLIKEITDPAWWLAFWIGISFFTPFVEEVLWRGVILRRFATKWGAPRALLVSSLIFGLMHGTGFFNATVLGLVFGLLYLRSGSLWVSIAAHVVWNAQLAFLSFTDVKSGWPIGLCFMLAAACLFYLMRSLCLPRLPLTLTPIPRSTVPAA